MLKLGVTRQLDTLIEEAPRFFRDEAAEASRLTTKEVAQRTPIGKRIDENTGEEKGLSGHLRRAWKMIVPRHEGTLWIGGSFNLTSYTGYVNDGTREHIIPKGGAAAGIYLHFFSHGESLVRAEVHHPGTRGKFMMELGLNEALRQYQRMSGVRLQRFLDSSVRR